MTGFERVLTALRHEEPDRIPFDLGASILTGMNIHAYKALRRYLGLKQTETQVQDITQQLAVVEDDVIDLLDVDVRGVQPAPIANAPLRTAQHLDASGKYYERCDEHGVCWRMPKAGGHYFDMASHPLANAETIDDLNQYTFPPGGDPSRFLGMKELADRYRFKEQRAWILGQHCAGIWEMALWLSGYEKFFCDMLAEKEFSHALMRKITDHKLAYWEKALDTAGDNVVIVSEADDLATQHSQLISVDLYKEMISPYHKELFGFIKKRATKNGAREVYIFYHTCGAMLPFADSLAEEGVDILNPVQVSAEGIETAALKKRIGDRFTFWGGGVDTQRVLPRGTPQEVKDEVRRRIDDLAPGGGFVFSTVHNVQSDVPPENYMAMWEALRAYGLYR